MRLVTTDRAVGNLYNIIIDDVMYVYTVMYKREASRRKKKGGCDRSQQDSNLRGQSPMDF